MDNQGSLAGKGITIDATELSNSSANAKMYSTDAIALNVQGNITNEDGALVHADSDLTLDTEGNLTNTDSTIEALNTIDIKANNVASSGTVLAQDGTLTIQTNKVDNQGTLAGKGITIDAIELSNSSAKAKIYSTDAIALNVQGNIINEDGALVHADTDLTLDAEGYLTNTESTIEALNIIDIKANNVANTGTVLAQDGALTIQTNKVDNQGTLAGKGITIDATELSNSTSSGKIYSTDAIALNVQGNVTNEDGALVHADSDLTLNTEGNLTNTDSTIEALNQVDIKSQNFTSSGTILAQDGALIIQTNQLDNQGSVAAKGIRIDATELSNSTVNGKVYSTDKLDFNITSDVINKEGALIHAGKKLTFDVEGKLTNSNSDIEAVQGIKVNSHHFVNSGSVLAQNQSLKIETDHLDNQGRLLGHGVEINVTSLLNNTVNSELLSTDHLFLKIDNDFINENGANIKANDLLTIDTKKNFYNIGSNVESANEINIIAQTVENEAGSVISTKKGTLGIYASNNVTNTGGISGNYVDIKTNFLKNSGGDSIILGRTNLKIEADSNLNNENGGVLYSLGTASFKTNGTLLNSSATIETIGDLNIDVNQLINKKKVFSVYNNVIVNEYSIHFQEYVVDLVDEFYRDYTEMISTPIVDYDSEESYILTSGNMYLKGLIDNVYSTISSVGDLIYATDNLNNVSYFGIKKTEEIIKKTDMYQRSSSSGYDVHVSYENNTQEEFITLASATFTAGGNIKGKAGNVSNVGAVDEVIAASIDDSDDKTLSQTELDANTTNSNDTSLVQTELDANTTNSNDTSLVQTELDANTTNSNDTSLAQTELDANTTNSNDTSFAQTELDVNTTESDDTSFVQTELDANTTNSNDTSLAQTELDANTTNSNDTSLVQTELDANTTNSNDTSLAQTELDANTTNSNDTSLAQTELDENTTTSNDGSLVQTELDANITSSNDTSLVQMELDTNTAKLDGKSIVQTELDANTTEMNQMKLSRTSDSLQVKMTGNQDEPAVNNVDLNLVKSRRDAIFNDLNVDSFVQSALYTPSENPDSDYLIQTNPLFTNYKNFVSSDYMLKKMVGDDQGRTGKTASRLGDGFLEQNLVREQILSYTGFQTLPDQVDIESAYETLMDNALEEYTDLQLSVGIELTDKQAAQLKQPIVWMVSETVQTDLGPQEALVPKVYFSNTSDMTLRPDGSLIAATNIDIQVDSDLVNSGAIVARSDLSISGENISNSGNMTAGNNVSLNASSDISNSGSMQANGALNLVAGGNITSETQSQTIETSSGTFASTQTLVGETATLQGATINLVAGNDISLIGSEVSADDQIFAQAGNDFTVASLAVTNSNKAGNNFNKSSTTHQISTLSANSLQLSAGNTITSQGAQLTADNDLILSANNIDLLAVKDTKDAYSFVGGGGNSTEKRSHNESITGTELSAGGTLTLVSQNDIFSKGSTLNGGEGIALAAGGDVVLTTETAHNSSYKQVKKKKSGLFGSKRSTTTTTSESLINQGTNLTSGGDLTIASGVDILLEGSKANAEGNISLQAGGDIQLLSAVDQTSQRYQKQKKGTFKVKAKDKGSIKQTAVTSDLVGGGNISLDSGSNITLEGATLAANDTLTIGTDAVTQNANGQYVNDKGELAGNVTVTTQALESSEWSESSSSFRGIFKDLVKGIAVIASTATAGLIHGEIKVGESDATRTDTLTQQTTTLAASNLNLTAQQDLALIGAQVALSDTANLTAQNVTIDAAQEHSVTTTSHTDQTVSGEGASFSSEKGELTLASITETDRTERTTTAANTWAGSSLQASNLNIQANKNVAIIGSDVTVQNDANIEGENVLIGGREDTTDTTNDSITKTKTLTVGVKNAYADTYLAVRALDQAKDAVKDAEAAYEDAKQKVADGKLPKSDLDFYKANLAVATANVASATTAVAASGAAAAAAATTSGGTGFYATAGVTTQTDTTSTTTSQGQWQGANIQVGGNTSLTSDNNLNVEGSVIATAGQLALNAQNINITAGKNTYTEKTESHSEGASVSVSMKADTTSLSGGVNANQSSSDSQSVTHINSQLVAGSLVSDSDNLTIEGGNLDADSIDITTDQLVVTSIQDTSSSNSKSLGGNMGAGGDGINNVGVNASQSEAERAWVAQQSGITGGQVNITAKDTSLTGAVLASTNAQGEDNGQMTLTTDTLSVSDIKDIDESKNLGISLSAGGDTTNIGANFDGYEKAQTTKTTIGLGDVTVGGSNIDEQAQFADLNRDITNSQEITKDVERGGLDANLTVDNRMLTASGRQQIANDVTDTYEHGEDIGRAVSRVNEDEDLGFFDYGQTLANNAKGTQLKNDLLRNPENKEILAGLKSENEEEYNQAVVALGHLAQDKFGLELSEINLYDGKATTSSSLADTLLSDVKGGVVVDANSSEAGKMYLDVNGESKTSQIDTLGHEVLETQDFQGQGQGIFFTNSESTQEALGDAFGAQLADRINQAAGGDLDSTGGSNFNQRQVASYSVQQGTLNANKVGNAEVDHRQLDISRSVASTMFEHAASVIVRDNSNDFSDEDKKKFGEPVEIEGQGVGYIFEALNIDLTDSETGENNNKLVPVVNGKYLVDGKYVAEPNLKEEKEIKTLAAIKEGNYSLHGDKKDDFNLEDSLMDVYYQDMTDSDVWKDYPSFGKTLRCAMLDCSGKNKIYNSNSYYYDAQIKAGQEPSLVNERVLLPGYPNYVPAFGPTPDLESPESEKFKR
ncbi:hemagglutinin repeat-containing protein [Marinomonas sp. TW1]|uniref:hemagglutinin repeat-containing protein n=1 Tax=Marinomonas sp. TW1 TaxID=1561203 RepID=UPI001E35EE73|nr:hemagglutinin repeat-containing protein [Marinomonas sp. TW1]